MAAGFQGEPLVAQDALLYGVEDVEAEAQVVVQDLAGFLAAFVDHLADVPAVWQGFGRQHVELGRLPDALELLFGEGCHLPRLVDALSFPELHDGLLPTILEVAHGQFESEL